MIEGKEWWLLLVLEGECHLFCLWVVACQLALPTPPTGLRQFLFQRRLLGPHPPKPAFDFLHVGMIQIYFFLSVIEVYLHFQFVTLIQFSHHNHFILQPTSNSYQLYHLRIRILTDLSCQLIISKSTNSNDFWFGTCS